MQWLSYAILPPIHPLVYFPVVRRVASSPQIYSAKQIAGTGMNFLTCTRRVCTASRYYCKISLHVLGYCEPPSSTTQSSLLPLGISLDGAGNRRKTFTFHESVDQVSSSATSNADGLVCIETRGTRRATLDHQNWDYISLQQRADSSDFSVSVMRC